MSRATCLVTLGHTVGTVVSSPPAWFQQHCLGWDAAMDKVELAFGAVSEQDGAGRRCRAQGSEDTCRGKTSTETGDLSAHREDGSDSLDRNRGCEDVAGKIDSTATMVLLGRTEGTRGQAGQSAGLR